MENKVETYFIKQSGEKRKISNKLRNIILKTFPGISEEYKWGAVVYDQGKFYIGVVKRGVNLGFAINNLSIEEKNFFKGKGKFMRHLKFETLESINEELITKLLTLVKNKVELVNI